MKIAVFSDLHVELGQPWSPPEDLDYDVLVLAGDIDKHTLGLQRFASWRTPVIYVAGNHEYYGANILEMLPEMRRVAPLAQAEQGRISTRFLECDAAVIDGVRYLGTTLWTDYGLFDQATRFRYMMSAERAITDHRVITVADGRSFRASDALKLHETSRAWLKQTLAEPFDGPTIVVTHHLPSARSVAERFRFDPVTPAFASDLTALIEQYQPELWIHGHTHDASDYRIGKTRVVCNPRGYPGERNTGFRPDLVVEV